MSPNWPCGNPGRRPDPAQETDDSLTLPPLCCHPTLRAVGGLTGDQIEQRHLPDRADHLG
ncbi:hypothetical protein [Streptosporangium saharense]|uniref:Uncharacterized protein n=1 Tax=Streptosporangium saharense TaxID=1706840 RepID=A0A7W7QT45_9ACTN|nr:hypothetical protein [Streptosporangium saharense]MBB4919233.1 hypothetical protein [Streptosporangium saharense]